MNKGCFGISNEADDTVYGTVWARPANPSGNIFIGEMAGAQNNFVSSQDLTTASFGGKVLSAAPTTSPTFSVCIGYQAGTGGANVGSTVAIGFQAGYGGGSQTVFIGANAGRGGGFAATYIGYGTGGNAVSAQNLVAIGANAALQPGNFMVIIGASALSIGHNPTNGVVIGYSAASSITGTADVCIGNFTGSAVSVAASGAYTTSGSSFTVTAGTLTILSNGMTVTDGTHTVTITGGPYAQGTTSAISTTASATSLSGALTTGTALTSGTGNTFLGASVAATSATISYATAIGFGVQVGASGCVAIGIDHTGNVATSSTQDLFVLGTSSHTVNIPGATQLGGLLTQYNAISTVSNGIPSEYATVDLTAQGALINTTTLYAVPATGAGMYRVSYYAKVTQAATASSTLGALTITSTDPDSNSISQVSSTSSTNSVTTGFITGSFVLYSKASANISYAMAYTSSGATPMQYNLHIKCEAL